MDSDNIELSLTLVIEDVELYTTTNSSIKLATTGSLKVLHVATYNSFIVQINDFRYSLDETIPILIAFHNKNGTYNYILPKIRGYYVIKMMDSSQSQAISKFETILKSHSRLAYKDNTEKDNVEAQEETADIDDIKLDLYEDNSSNMIVKEQILVTSSKGRRNGKKGSVFSSLFCKKDKKSQDNTPTKYLAISQEKSVIRNNRGAPMDYEATISLDREYLQGLIIAGKAIGQEIERVCRHKNREINYAEEFKSYQVVGSVNLETYFQIYKQMNDTILMIENERASAKSNNFVCDGKSKSLILKDLDLRQNLKIKGKTSKERV